MNLQQTNFMNEKMRFCTWEFNTQLVFSERMVG